MIHPSKVCLFIPAGLKKFKLKLFERVAKKISEKGGLVVHKDPEKLMTLSRDIIPVIGCHPETTDAVHEWKRTDRPWIYWDRGYCLRWFATSLPQPATIEESFYRFHLNCFQMQTIADVPPDRWNKFKVPVRPWAKEGRHIVVAAPSKTYNDFHRSGGWLEQTLDKLARITKRQLVIRHKEQVITRSLKLDLEGAHCLVTHGSIAAVESVIHGCPVFVHPDSAAALVGKTDLAEIENPAYPDRQPWMNALGYSQWNEHELVDGTLWRQLAS